METNIVADISLPIPYLAKFWFSSYGPTKLHNSFKCNISRKKWMMKFIYNMQMNIGIFYKLILSCWMCVTRHAQSTQNKKFTYLCNISRKIWGIKLIFCLQINAKVLCKLIVSLWICLARHAQITQQSLQNLCNVSRKEWRVKLIFCM